MPTSSEKGLSNGHSDDIVESAVRVGLRVGRGEEKRERWLWFVMGVLVAALLFNWYQDSKMSDKLEALKWRVDELRAIHKED